MSPEWVKRPYVPEDEAAIVYLWLKSYARSRYGLARGADRATTEAERDYWEEHAPVVEWFLRNATIEVICDPQRVDYAPGAPAVIYAFACTTGDTVHMLVVKRSAAQLGLGADMARDLLAGRLDRPCMVTHEMPDLRKLGLLPVGQSMPREWTFDTTWLGRMHLGRRAA